MEAVPFSIHHYEGSACLEKNARLVLLVSFEPGTNTFGNKNKKSRRHVPNVERCIYGHVRLNLCDRVQRVPQVLPVHEVVQLRLLGRMKARHGRDAPCQLGLEVDLRVLEQLRFPTRCPLHADALRGILPAQHRSSGGGGLWPEREKCRIQRRELDEVVREAETLLGPPGAPQVAPQERVHGGLMQAEAQHRVHLARRRTHLRGRARAVGDEGEPGGELQVVLHVALAVPANGQQRAGHAHQLELGPLHGVPRDVGVHVPVGAEQHVLRVRQPVCRKGHLHPGVHL
mmetsp:Transcript_105484/g.275426  ORF Transcript_105484/g.275426 Transcript_105484/m.275426 type:complete len:286 (-) Transcript_105484:393-1250(-)